MAQALVSPSPFISLIGLSAAKSSQPRASLQLPNSSSKTSSGLASPFRRGLPLSIRNNSRERKMESRALSFSIRCEQGAKASNGLDVWLGRLAMVGFASAITVEIATGKGLLENFGLVTPVPTLALVVTALVGVLTAFFIFQSASRD